MPQIIIATLETAFNRLLQLDPEAADKLAAMEGKIIALHLQGLNLTLYFFPSADEVMILEDFDAEPDTLISGTPIALIKLGLASDKQAEMFAGEVSISGDLRLGRQFNQIFASLDIDWEEQLSKVVGDMAARSIGNLSRSLFSWHQRNESSMKMNIGEYLQEEVHYLPSRNEVDYFMQQVDLLRDDVSRFEARLNKLEKRSGQQKEKQEKD